MIRLASASIDDDGTIKKPSLLISTVSFLPTPDYGKYNDISFTTSLQMYDKYNDISFTTSLRMYDKYNDIPLTTSLQMYDKYNDISFTTSLRMYV